MLLLWCKIAACLCITGEHIQLVQGEDGQTIMLVEQTEGAEKLDVETHYLLATAGGTQQFMVAPSGGEGGAAHNDTNTVFMEQQSHHSQVVVTIS